MDKMDYNLPQIQNQALFRDMSADEIGEIISGLNGMVLDFEKGDYLNRLLDRYASQGMACILSGCALLLKYDTSGNQAVLDFVMPGYLIGCYRWLPVFKFAEVKIKATSKGQLLCLDGEKFTADNMAQIPLLAKMEHNIVNILAERSYRLLRKADIISAHSLREKILAFLNAQRDYCRSNTFEIPMDRQEMADYLYANRSALSRELSSLRKEGLIHFDRNRFTLFYP